MLNILKLHLLCTLLLVGNTTTLSAQTLFDFESLTLPDTGFYQGDPDGPGAELNLFTVDSSGPAPFGSGQQFVQRINVQQNGQSVDFANTFTTDPTFGGFYSGFAISNTVDTTTPGFGNQYAAFPGSGAEGSSNYLIASGDGSSVTASLFFETIDITNTTYTALAALGDDGNGIPSPFIAGPLADFDGYLDLIITGSNSTSSGNQIVVSLADYRNGADFLSDDWRTIDVSALQTDELTFSFDGSDVGTFGLNTPAYFAIDNVVLSAVPEPSALLISLGAISGFLLRRRRS